MALSGLNRVAAKRLDRPRPLDGNGKHATMARGKPMYRLGSPNPMGANQFNPNLMNERFGPSAMNNLARISALKLRGRI